MLAYSFQEKNPLYLLLFEDMIFAVDHPLCDVWNQKKTQILIEFLDGTKKVQLFGKKSSARV